MRSTTGKFDAFLYATVEHEEGAAALSVLSVLARLDVDPWDEAARLAALPRDVATSTLKKIIASLPARSAAHAHSVALVSRLIALLPTGRLAEEKPAALAVPVAAPRPSTRGIVLQAAAYAILAASILGADWAINTPQDVTPAPAAAASATAPPDH